MTSTTLPDVIASDLSVLFCGINPGLYTAKMQQHFGRPGNRFWPTLHRAGFTPRLFHPSEQHELLKLGYGITNIVARASAAADELTREELIEGAKALTRKVKRYKPKVLAIVGIGASPHGVRASESETRLAGRDHRRNEDLGTAEPEWPERQLPGRRADGVVHGAALVILNRRSAGKDPLIGSDSCHRQEILLRLRGSG